MYMQSNQPFKQDSVLDGALMGGALAAGGMGVAHYATPGIEKNARKAMKENIAHNKKVAAEGNKLKTDKTKQIYSERQKLMSMGVKPEGIKGISGLSDTLEVNKAGDELKQKHIEQNSKSNKSENTKRKASHFVNKNMSSGKGKAMMYGGSIIAGALGGALIDSNN